MVVPRGSPPELAASMFTPPMLAEVHSFESLRGFHELDSPVIVADYLLPQNPRVVWANAAARSACRAKSVEDMQGAEIVSVDGGNYLSCSCRIKSEVRNLVSL